jgi:hypothetical protein
MPYLLIMRVTNDKGRYPYRLVSDTIPRVGEIIIYIEHQTYVENRFIVDKVEHLYSEKSQNDHISQIGHSVNDGYPKLEIYVTRTNTFE